MSKQSGHASVYSIHRVSAPTIARFTRNPSARPASRGLHSSALQLNVSAFCGIGVQLGAV